MGILLKSFIVNCLRISLKMFVCSYKHLNINESSFESLNMEFCLIKAKEKLYNNIVVSGKFLFHSLRQNYYKKKLFFYTQLKKGISYPPVLRSDSSYVCSGIGTRKIERKAQKVTVQSDMFDNTNPKTPLLAGAQNMQYRCWPHTPSLRGRCHQDSDGIHLIFQPFSKLTFEHFVKIAVQMGSVSKNNFFLIKDEVGNLP